MQIMNTDQQTYYSNSTGPQQVAGNYYLSNGIEPRKIFLFII